MGIKFLSQLPLKGARVLMRVDFNVPLNKDGTISDDSKIQAALPSIEYILSQDASIVLMSHLGRPEGKKKPSLSLAPCAQRLSELLHKPVMLAPDCIGPAVEALAENLQPKQVMLLENVRFHIGEEHPEQDLDFVRHLAKLGELYVNDAFGSAHRAHASTALVAKFFPEKAAAGFLIEKELSFLIPLLHDPPRPFYAILGGAKISTKAGVIHNLLKKVDALFLGGGMCFPFFKAKGIPIGKSLCSDEEVQTARNILHEKPQLFLPLDLVVTEQLTPTGPSHIQRISNGINPNEQGVDIGPETVREWGKILKRAATIFWNGPLGVFEVPPFAKGTEAIAQILSESTATTIIGGGDSIAAIRQMGLQDRFAYLSTGGGASLEFLEFGHLPGIDALS